MYYSFDLTIPADTAATAPTELDVEMVPGVITRVGIQFPPGCVGMVYVQVFQEFHQLFPSNPGESLNSDGVIIEWDESHRLVQGQSLLTLRGWSPGTTYPHTISFRFALEPALALVPALPLPVLPLPVIQTLELP